MRRAFIVFVLLVAALFAAGPAGAKPRPRHARKAKAAAPRHAAASRPAVPLDPGTVNDPGLAPPVSRRAKGGAVLRAQVLLARAHFSVGEIDAAFGENMRKAVSAFQRARGISETGAVDDATWQALDTDSAPVVGPQTIAPEDVAGPFVEIPEDMTEKAKLTAMAYQTPLEGLAEKVHANPSLLKELNPGASFDQAGVAIIVPLVAVPPPARAARVVVSKSERSVTALDAEGRILAWYPATTGSDHDPLPIGEWKIMGVRRNPDFHYNPDLFWDAKSTDRKARIAPGPNNPVGVAWLDLSKPHYGIHGTPEPSTIGKTASHGCIRLTNWDVWELQQIVAPGTPAVLED